MSELTVEQIEKVLDEKVRPDLRLHGGDIQIAELDGTILRVRMTGHCSGCPSADLTMETLVDSELRNAFPELTQVALLTGVSDSLIAEAMSMLKKRHEAS